MHFKYRSVYMSIPISLTIPSPWYELILEVCESLYVQIVSRLF